jgi:L-ascorbate metabolism protein UlaG (beta-lactamase superfamily)
LEYKYNPDLPFVKEGWLGNPYQDGAFQYLQDPFFPEWKTVLRMMTTTNPQAEEKKADQWIPPVAQDKSWIKERDTDFIIWLGHACFIIQLGGVRLITDPVLYSMPMVPRRVFPPFPVSDILGIDYILISHDHRDHCDRKTIKELLAVNPNACILSTLGMEQTVNPWINGTPLVTAGWYQRYHLPAGHPQITFLPTRHWSRRGIFDFNSVLWGAFLIEHQGRRYYFGGDSAMQWHFEETGQLFPGIDLAMLAIGAYAPDYMMQGAHMNPAEAVTAFEQLGASRLIPMHHGTYDLSNEPASEPHRWVQTEMNSRNRLTDLLLPAINEVIVLS